MPTNAISFAQRTSSIRYSSESGRNVTGCTAFKLDQNSILILRTLQWKISYSDSVSKYFTNYPMNSGLDGMLSVRFETTFIKNFIKRETNTLINLPNKLSLTKSKFFV